jgi:mono/diheme cytochrome c family protein
MCVGASSARILILLRVKSIGRSTVSRVSPRLLVPALLSIALACGGEGEAPTTPQAQPAAPAAAPAAPPAAPVAGAADARAEAEQIFTTRCVTCHGPQGAGDGPASAGLTPPPRNFQDPAWQAAVGKSAAMPGNPDLMSKPDVVAALRAFVRGLKR